MLVLVHDLGHIKHDSSDKEITRTHLLDCVSSFVPGTNFSYQTKSAPFLTELKSKPILNNCSGLYSKKMPF